MPRCDGSMLAAAQDYWAPNLAHSFWTGTYHICGPWGASFVGRIQPDVTRHSRALQYIYTCACYIYNIHIHICIYICMYIIIIIYSRCTRWFICGVSSLFCVARLSVNLGKPWPSHAFSLSSRESLKLWTQLAIRKLRMILFLWGEWVVLVHEICWTLQPVCLGGALSKTCATPSLNQRVANCLLYGFPMQGGFHQHISTFSHMLNNLAWKLI